ncbi:MAG: hypothetical protein DCC51_09495 [Anaerolineae bacterium]|nr:MAG: hypothetical protein DCC51_09495 [Anaerolineae bacterium]
MRAFMQPSTRRFSSIRRANIGYGLRFLCISVIISLIRPSPQRITFGPPQPVITNQPILGVHTRLTDEVEEWKIQRTLQMVREMGATHIVEFFPWAYYQAEDGSIAWEHPDLVIGHARANGLKVIARIGYTPDWARPPDTPLTYLDQDAYDEFAAFANANPDVQILAGALAPTVEPEGSPWAINDLTYLRGMYEVGAASFFDGLAVHAYGLTFPAEAEPAPEILNFRRVELLREIMVEFGDETTPIYITETGWNDHPRWTMAVRPGQRINYTLAAIDYAAENWPYVKSIALWAFRYPAPTRSYPDYFTLVTPEFMPKPIYDALKEYTGN